MTRAGLTRTGVPSGELESTGDDTARRQQDERRA